MQSTSQRKALRFAAGLLTLLLAVFVGRGAFSPPASAAVYHIGDTWDVPITITSTTPVILADFTVTVVNGELVTLTCGGTGFTPILSSSNHCTLIHELPGTTNSIAATVTVRAVAAGTLIVSAAGTLSNALTLPITGTLTGGSFSVEADNTNTSVPTNTNSPSNTNTSLPTNTTTNSTPTNTNTTIIRNTNTTTTVPTPKKSTPPESTNEVTIIREQTTITQPTTTSTETTNALSSTSNRIVLTANDTKLGRPITIGDVSEIYFAAGSLDPNSVPIKLILTGREEQWLNFQEYLVADAQPTQVQLPQEIVIVRVVDGTTLSVTLPKGVVLWSRLTPTGLATWDGRILAPYFSHTKTARQEQWIAGLGLPDGQLELNQAAPIVMSGLGRWSAWHRRNENYVEASIADACPTNIASLPILTSSSECRFLGDDDLVIWTNHFSQFVATRAMSNWWILGALGGVGLLILLILGATLHAKLTKKT